ncbi:tetratricopeptide repeat protein [Chryseobacterium sp.]|uniref:tetratricopeptide repeat protein n=1 Tax=Chryseobacterium sp. TaxID=1871047 RepID=UPI00260E2E1B|nr:tetratricopeptide repeat protein [Chryseobacterium sp.]
MNPRILELIKNPKNIQLEDLGLLKEEIHTFPYIQNIRALHLYGVHLYEKENYQKELSVTAAYTTDKKILYQLINGKIKQEEKVEVQPAKPADKAVQQAYKNKSFPIKREDEIPSEQQKEEESVCLLSTSEEILPIYVNGERNRILFEGEENFLEDKNSETIDIESTLESGTLITQKAEPATEPELNEKEETQAEIEENGGEEFTSETIINEDEISSEPEEEKIVEEENISFEETEAILPGVTIEENTSEKSTEPEAVSENENIHSVEVEQQVQEPDAEVSFHGTEAFLPDVKIETSNEELAETAEVSQPNVNKHEDEMRRLIEEVEKKMKEAKSAPEHEKVETEPVPDHEISFAETQSFHFWSTSEESIPSEEVKTEAEPEEITEIKESVRTDDSKEEIGGKELPEVQSTWKPMSVESNVPDSLINKSAEVSTPPVAASIEETTVVAAEEVKKENQEPEIAEETLSEEILPAADPVSKPANDHAENNEALKESPGTIATKEDEVAVMNVSFFGTDISSLSVQEKENKDKEESVKEETAQEAMMKKTTQPPADSNVPGFINTWQSWLKIDRIEEVEKVKVEIKEKAIETFIENNPRISQLKEESTYVVKEKNDDISHLMTETLAKLYFEQKLYTKAIKAFEILIKKNPEKKDYFKSKIQEVKDFRSKN